MRERRAAIRRLRRSCASATVAIIVAVVIPTGRAGAAATAATAVTAAELRELIRAALSDPAVARELRQVDRVDGRPVDLERVLDGANGADLEARLRALDQGLSGAPSAEPGAPGPADPRTDARRILEDRRFHPSAVPRPFRGLFRTVGRWLRPVTDPLGRAWSAMFDDALTVGVLGAVVAGLATLISVRMIRRRSSAGVERLRRAGRFGRQDDPDELERWAADAERDGEFGLAVRLRFRAGLLRLDQAGVVADRPALTTGALISEFPSPVLRRLAVAFEEVAYGGRAASPDDVAEARAGWRRVLEDVTR